MTTRKAAVQNFDKKRLADRKAEGSRDPFEFIFGGITWTVDPKPIPVEVSMDIMRAQVEASEAGTIVDFYESLLYFIYYVLGTEQVSKFADMLRGIDMDPDEVVDVSDVITLAFWLLEKVSERPS